MSNYSKETAAVKAVLCETNKLKTKISKADLVNLRGISIADFIKSQGIKYPDLISRVELFEDEYYIIFDDTGQFIYSNLPLNVYINLLRYIGISYLDIDFSSLNDIPRSAFSGNKTLREVTSSFKNIKNLAATFQNCTTLEKFSGDLSSLETVNETFNGCTSLKTFTSTLPNLKDGSGMFFMCKGLQQFSTSMPNLVKGINMFAGCTGLTSFTSDISKVQIGYQMFNGCGNLTTFTSKLTSLISGNYMFYSTRLSKSSVLTIFNSLKYDNTCTGQEEGASPILRIGLNRSECLNDPDILNILDTPISASTTTTSITNKMGTVWTIYINWA